jgi:hypothetical protein
LVQENNATRLPSPFSTVKPGGSETIDLGTDQAGAFIGFATLIVLARCKLLATSLLLATG